MGRTIVHLVQVLNEETYMVMVRTRGKESSGENSKQQGTKNTGEP